LRAFLGVPNVVSLHSGDLYDPSKWTSPHRHPPLRRWVRSLLLRADEFVGQSNDTLERARAIYVPERAGVRILLGIEPPPEGAAARRADYGLAEEDVVAITVGRLIPRKAVDQLVRVVAALGLARLRLLVVGDGPLAASLAALARDLGVERQVRLLGRVPEAEKFGLLRMADFLCSASQHEGFGLSYLEAMACGRPIVAYDNGGQRDFVEQGVAGFLAPLNDQAVLAARCRALAEDPALRAALGAGARRRAETLTIEACAREYEALFAKAVAARAGARAGTA
jgi:glycosyltransferase involved in cell wall biosynthesis